MDDATDVFCHWSTNRELPLRVPDHQVGVVARRQAALLLVQAAQLGRPLAQQPGQVRQREAPPTSRAPEQRQTCAGSQGHKVIEALTQHPLHWACVPVSCSPPSDFDLFLVWLARQTPSVYLPG